MKSLKVTPFGLEVLSKHFRVGLLERLFALLSTSIVEVLSLRYLFCADSKSIMFKLF
jgi:hypothetical protein